MADKMSVVFLLFGVLLTAQVFNVTEAGYNHNVAFKPECERRGDQIPSKCVYNFTIDYRMTGVWYNERRNTGKPVFKTDAKPDQYFYGEQYNCSNISMSESDLDDVIMADGSYRRIYTINGQFPGETIVAYNGTQLIISVTNNLEEEGVSIHWHGIVQRNTPYMDGVARITQCAINPGETFVYRFVAYPPGTHWYHAHLGSMRTDGLYGALIVIDPEEERTRARKETDMTLMLSDWFSTDTSTMSSSVIWELERFAPFLQSSDSFTQSSCFYQTKQHDGTDIGVWPVQSILINGKGTVCDATRDVTVGGYRCNNRLEEFVVPRHKKIRIRIINGAAQYSLRVSIDSHSMTVEALDGNRIQDMEVVDYLIIHTGERYDIEVATDQYREHPIQPVNDGHFWIRVESLEEADQLKPIINPKTGWAILKYEGSPSRAKPFTTPKQCPQSNPCEVLNCPFRDYRPVGGNYYTCIPISQTKALGSIIDRYPVPMPTSDDDFQQIFLNFHFSGSNAVRSSINGHLFRFPRVPPQLYPDQDPLYECDEPCTGDCYCTYSEKLKLNNVIQIVIMNMGIGQPGTAHPVHIHGHHFHVLKIGYPQYDSDFRFLADTDDIRCKDPFCSSAEWSDATWDDYTVWNNTARRIRPPDVNANANTNTSDVGAGDVGAGGVGAGGVGAAEPWIPEINVIDPPLKDTVVVPVGGYVVVRFRADNPGWWFVHCHIEVHTVEGMAMVLQEGEQSEMPPVPSKIPKCANFEMNDKEFDEALQWKPNVANLGSSKASGAAATRFHSLPRLLIPTLCFLYSW
ncbi:L-ascorbate oxidase [Lingula anatina]|uniref:L-ascorbate oxidase n=1 Tax=Lingula anatina TaxID=7574 RepID=A0A1S3HL83_LINAN|nr:L-ascorbate oxidase [Lingula anatina]|eukprot:XP_013385769.1 L-ascorbate oxidase [Lingula anatina]